MRRYHILRACLLQCCGLDMPALQQQKPQSVQLALHICLCRTASSILMDTKIQTHPPPQVYGEEKECINCCHQAKCHKWMGWSRRSLGNAKHTALQPTLHNARLPSGKTASSRPVVETLLMVLHLHSGIVTLMLLLCFSQKQVVSC